MKRRVLWKRIILTSVLAGAMILPAAAASAQTITVKPGDTLYLLAKQYGLTVDHLKIANHLTGDMLIAGSSLFIPPRSFIYTVQWGDTLWKLAARYETTISAIQEANQLKGDSLFAGSRLLIPQAPNGDKPWTEMTTYSVKPGDNAWNISIAHGIPMTEFLQVNHLTESSQLAVGQQVKIPVHHIPVTPTPGPQYGEYLDWFEAAQYLFPINAVATVTDFKTGVSFRVKRTIGAFHADCEPLTAQDAAIIKQVWGGAYSWDRRPVIVQVNGRRIAASMASMPHSIEFIKDNDFPGHFDIHFLNSLRHKDNQIDPAHQENIKIAAGRS